MERGIGANPGTAKGHAGENFYSNTTKDSDMNEDIENFNANAEKVLADAIAICENALEAGAGENESLKRGAYTVALKRLREIVGDRTRTKMVQTKSTRVSLPDLAMRKIEADGRVMGITVTPGIEHTQENTEFTGELWLDGKIVAELFTRRGKAITEKMIHACGKALISKWNRNRRRRALHRMPF